MPRQRYIKPEAFGDRTLCTRSWEAQHLWIVLLLFSDDYGAFEADPIAILGFGFRHRPEALECIPGWLTELCENGLIVLYRSGDEEYGLFPKWHKHQNVKNPGLKHLPRPGDDSTYGKPGPYGGPTGDLRRLSIENDQTPVTTGPTETLRRVGGDSTPHTTYNREQRTGSGGGSAHDTPLILAALKSAGYAPLLIDQDLSAIAQTLAEVPPPPDVDWMAVGQKIRRKRQDGTIESERPVSGLRFVLKGSGVPRLGQFQPPVSSGAQVADERDAKYEAAIIAAGKAGLGG
jgi:hypothetical protein